MAKRSSADADADGAAASDGDMQGKNKHQRVEAPAVDSSDDSAEQGCGPTATAENGASNNEMKQQPQSLCCSGCGISDSAAHGSLLLFDDPEEDNKEEDVGNKTASEEEKR